MTFQQAWSLFQKSRWMNAPADAQSFNASARQLGKTLLPAEAGHVQNSPTLAPSGWQTERREIGIDGVVAELHRSPDGEFALTFWQ